MPIYEQLNYYKVLGLRPDCDQAEIGVAYRRLVKTSHPDREGDSVLFRLVQEAYDHLKTPQVRAQYDHSITGTSYSGTDETGSTYTPPPSYTPPQNYQTGTATSTRARAHQQPAQDRHVWEQDDWDDLEEPERAAARQPAPAYPLWRRAWPHLSWPLRLLATLYGAGTGLATAIFWHVQATYTGRLPIIGHQIGNAPLRWAAWFVLVGALLGPPVLAAALRRGTKLALALAIAVPLWATAGTIVAINLSLVLLFLVLLRIWDRHRGIPTIWIA
jgi:hypothetical protein